MAHHRFELHAVEVAGDTRENRGALLRVIRRGHDGDEDHSAIRLHCQASADEPGVGREQADERFARPKSPNNVSQLDH